MSEKNEPSQFSAVETEPSLEFIDEEPFFKLRVNVVEQEAASGEYGKQMRFKSSVEREFQVVQAREIVDHLAKASIDEKVLTWSKEQKILLPSDISLLAHQGDELDEHYRQVAREEIAVLESETEDEENRKNAWLAEIDQFTTEDIINFRLYAEFSTATLKDPQPPRGLSFEQLTKHAEQGKYLEFRFGKGTLQEGYYDNPGISEFRTNPYAPSETIAIEPIVMQRLADIAAEHGAVIVAAGKHVNLSVYTEQEGSSMWQPVIGRSEDRQRGSLAAVSGLSAAIESGAWITDAQAKDRFTYGLAGGREHQITGNRNAIRLQEDYVELRSPDFVDSTAHALLWSMAGMTYGIEQETIESHTPARLTHKVVVERTDNFDKNKDLQLQRALEQSEFSTEGDAALDLHHALARGRKICDSIFGKDAIQDATLSAVTSQLYVSSLTIQPDGSVNFDRRKFTDRREELPPLYDELLGKSALDILSGDSALRVMELYTSRNAVRVRVKNVIEATPKFLNHEPEELEARWLDSPIINRMYGQLTPNFARQIARTGREHYVPIDVSDDESFRQAIAELIARRQ